VWTARSMATRESWSAEFLVMTQVSGADKAELFGWARRTGGSRGRGGDFFAGAGGGDSEVDGDTRAWSAESWCGR
jgi:hypothetical protein